MSSGNPMKKLSLGSDRVTADVLALPERGPICASSFEALRRHQKTAKGPTAHIRSCSTTSCSSHGSRGLDEGGGAPLRGQFLILTTYGSTRDWQASCVCSGAGCRGGDGPSCPAVLVYIASPEDSSATEIPIVETNPLNIVCTTYASLNARPEPFLRVEWSAVVLEFSCMIPRPESTTMRNILGLVCAQWYTVNKPATGCDRPPRFDTKWQDIYLQANGATAEAATATDLRGVLPARSGCGSFWRFVEPGVGNDCAFEALPVCSSLVKYLASCPTPVGGSSSVDRLRISCPVLVSPGFWFMTAEPCQADREMLEIVCANTPYERHANLIREYFQTTHCPLDFATLKCKICGGPASDALMKCCQSTFHRDCLLTEFLAEAACPYCKAPVSEPFLEEVEAWLLAPGSYCFIDVAAEKLRAHDWSCQLTRQNISSAVQQHLRRCLEEAAEGGLTADYSVRCYTARVHNSEALTDRIFQECRELPLVRSASTAAPGKMADENIFLFFTAQGTDTSKFVQRNEKDRYLVVSLGCIDLVRRGLRPRVASDQATLPHRLKLLH